MPQMGAISGWHKGERAIQDKMGYAGVMSQAWTWIKPEMSEEHKEFFTTRLPLIPVTTIDDRRRPWASILAGPDGQPGFATSRHLGELTLNAHVWEGDPFAQNAAGSRESPVLIAGIGVEFSTRRRNKFAGYIDTLEKDGPILRVRSVVNEAIGNCPKYINVRDLVPHADTHPRVVYRRLDLLPSDRLPENVISLIHDSDTLFLGTFHDTERDGEGLLSHVGMNQRGGRPGFARVQHSDGRTLVIPDYSGNRLLTSLGNIEATPLAGVTFVSFLTGSVLYLTGDAHNFVGPPAQRLMPRINALTTIYVTGYILVEDALPVRQRAETQVQCSPYSPPVRQLAEEITSTYFADVAEDSSKVTLTRIEIHSHDIVTFTFESAKHLDIVPGQAAIFDFKSVVGALPYQHMAPGNPTSVNDDRIRTWTVSGSSRWKSSSGKTNTPAGPLSLMLTMRHKPGGVVTSALFAIAHRLGEVRQDLLEDTRSLQLSVPLVGIAGDLILPTGLDICSPEDKQPSTRIGTQKWLWIAGGIGVTPFLAMLAALREKKCDSGHEGLDDIVLLLSTREPDVLLPLVVRALEYASDDDNLGDRPRSKMLVHVFSRSPSSPSLVTTGSRSAFAIEVTEHKGRLDEETLCALNVKDLRDRQVYLCGPEGFEQTVLAALKGVGVGSGKVKREVFAY